MSSYDFEDDLEDLEVSRLKLVDDETKSLRFGKYLLDEATLNFV